MPDPGYDLPVAPLAPEYLEPLEPEPKPLSEDDALLALLRPHEAAAVGWETEPGPVPFARLASLDYATPAVAEPPFIEAVDELAEKLANVQVADEDPGSMVDCPHCGSRITTYARRCNYCRHPLLGP
jgi:hypothetical protein